MTEALDHIIPRLEKLMKHFDLSASSFAERIGVQRSSISHLLSGRNKPSLEFILKVNSSFPEINLKWLLLGQGDFITIPQNQKLPFPKEPNPVLPPPPVTSKSSIDETGSELDLERIVFFYANGTFSTYLPEKKKRG